MLLKQNNVTFKVVEYLKVPLKKNEIHILARKLGKRPKEFLRKGESDFKQNDVGSYLEDDEKIIEFLEKYPKIMERPIFVNDKKAIVGRPPKDILLILD